MRKTSIKLKNRSGTDVVFNDINTVSLEGVDGNKKVFSLGNLTEGTIILDFTNGNQEVVVPDDELYNKVIVLKPDNFIAENIAEGVVIAGIEGTFEGAKEMPTLNTPSIRRDGDTITITNPSTNGNFNKGFNVYANGELAFYQTGTTLSLKGMFEAEKDYLMEATCVNPLMNESGKSNSIAFAIYSVNKVFDEYITTIDTNTRISDGMKYTFIIKSAFGYWLPEIIKVYKKSHDAEEYELTDEYKYSMYSGEITFEKMDANIKIEVNADTEPQLKRPDFELIDETNYFATEFPKFAEKLFIYHEDELIMEETKADSSIGVEVETLDTQYTFEFDEVDEYFKPQNTGIHNSFAMCRIKVLNLNETPINVKLLWMQDTETYSDYAIIGHMDTELSKNTNMETDVLFDGKNKRYTTPQELMIEVPNGEHFFDVKFRKNANTSYGWDMFLFKLDQSQIIRPIVSDEIHIDADYTLKLANPDYEDERSANATHHIYLDDELTYVEKEGI